ncbi:hypothetical protein N7519_009352 [Penicillium mononematosum]|uniref:uncharacterized protein n=1 Tax=Penicillium mononematosum TaxID=268346 RepID=UPI002548628E|nr:uncharacterized protein N7519_009352 [Penicillium mononematosum]KAJ6178891.1 hypothetical protein N7519_009352 [Penicillium mononematosum]
MALMAMALCDADEVVFQEKSEGIWTSLGGGRALCRFVPSLVLIREGGGLSTNHNWIRTPL